MTNVKDILDNIPPSSENDESAEALMANPDYLRHSSAIISEALQKGFDVLQLENGDIVTTGTKIVVTQYHWDSAQEKMIQLSSQSQENPPAAAE